MPHKRPTTLVLHGWISRLTFDVKQSFVPSNYYQIVSILINAVCHMKLARICLAIARSSEALG
jgi:hypothetical protein